MLGSLSRLMTGFRVSMPRQHPTIMSTNDTPVVLRDFLSL